MRMNDKGIWSAARDRALLTRMREWTVPRYAPLVATVFAFVFLSPSSAWAFSEAGTGLEQNSAISEQIDLTVPVTLANGGTGTAAGSANAAFNALSPLTTKGDVLTFSTVNARLGAGANGTVLKAASGETTGLIFEKIDVSDTNEIEGEIADANVSNTLTVDIDTGAVNTATTSKCARFDGSGNLVAASGDCTAGDTGGADTTVPGKLAMRSSVKFSMGASETKYMALDGSICTTEADCLIPFEAGVIDNVTCMSTVTQTASNVTIKMGDGPCTGSPTYGTGFDIPATARTSATASESFTFTSGDCGAIQITTGAGEAFAFGYLTCSADVTGPAA